MDLATQLSLLERLKRTSANADWERFYTKYRGVILGFARKRGLDEHSASDALQETMMVVMRKLPLFEYDSQRGRFRNWLLTIVAHKVREAVRRSHVDRLLSMDAMSPGGLESLQERLASEVPDASENVEAVWRQSLMEEALRRVLDDSRTRPDTVDVFRACALENKPVAEVAAQFGLKGNAVYQIKNRMMTRLQLIVAELENEHSAQLTDT